MKKSEMILGTVTGVAAVVFVAFQFGGLGERIDSMTSSSGASTDQVAQLEVEYTSMVDRLLDAPKIYRDFALLTGKEGGLGEEMSADGRPDLVFQENVARWCVEAGFQQPNVTKSIEDIEGVEDYQMVFAFIRIDEGDLPRLSNLLKDFERRGLIIRELELTGYRDSARVSASIGVGQIVETFFQDTPARRRRRT
jgi:hypothetical protein